MKRVNFASSNGKKFIKLKSNLTMHNSSQVKEKRKKEKKKRIKPTEI